MMPLKQLLSLHHNKYQQLKSKVRRLMKVVVRMNKKNQNKLRKARMLNHQVRQINRNLEMNKLIMTLQMIRVNKLLKQ